MNTNRIWALFSVVILVAGVGLYLLYSSKETERNLRMEKEMLLGSKTTELTQTQAQLASLTEEKRAAEEALNSKIESLNSLIKDYDENIRSQSGKIDSLAADNDSLRRERESLQRQIDSLSQKIQALESERSNLTEKIRREGAGRRSAADTSSDGRGYEDDAPQVSTMAPPAFTETEAVQLGNIVMQQSSGSAVAVQSVNRLYGFLVLNAGSNDGLEKDLVVNIVRDKQLIGKAVVQKVQDNVSAAMILPEYTRQEVRVGDLITQF